MNGDLLVTGKETNATIPQEKLRARGACIPVGRRTQAPSQLAAHTCAARRGRSRCL